MLNFSRKLLSKAKKPVFTKKWAGEQKAQLLYTGGSVTVYVLIVRVSR